MANLFFDLPATAGNGSGAGVAVNTQGREKTITVQGVFSGTVNVEVSLDAGTTWFSVATFLSPSKKIVNVAADMMRATRSGVATIGPGLPNVDVGSNDDGALFLALPATAGDGFGASINVSAIGTFNTVSVIGAFAGTVAIEISEDGINWTQCFSFTNPGHKSKTLTTQFMRVARGGVTAIGPGLPVVNVGAINDTTVGGGGGGGVDRSTFPEKWTQLDVPAAQVALALSALVSTIFDDIQAIRPGSIIGLNVRFNGILAAGSATATITINGAPGVLAVTVLAPLDAGRSTQAAGVDAYVAGDLIGVELSTTTAFLPAGSLDIEAWVDIQH